MELMIYISEEDFEAAKKVDALYGEWRNDITSRSLRAIAYGTPLPKGHGDLIDADKLISSFPNYDGMSDVAKTIDYAPTIIEANKEMEE